ncbi:tyrosine-type recombinase/integrase [Agromyces sp. ZXT2-6]|uniref:tyrosine-type recombinase/integrase n=1 Tax=Agromyces sp. ZXT2-6 TaxID=3461153 RepID=UPI004054B020
MVRPPLPLETWGSIRRKVVNGKPVAIAYFRDSDGKTRRIQKTGPSAAEAERRLLVALRDRQPPDGTELTLDSTLRTAANRWLEEVKRDRRAPSTIDRYSATIERHVHPVGELLLRELSVSRLQRLVNAVADVSGPSEGRMVLVVLKGIASHALRLGAMRENPALGVKAPSIRRTKMRIPTVQEVRALRLALRAYDERPVKRGDAMHDLADIGDFLIGTGCRIGEALALRWKAVDLSRGVVVLSATVVRVAGEGLVVQDFPKTEASIRELALPRFALDMLARRRIDAYSELVFPSATGGPRWPENVRYQWSQALHGSEIDWITPKSARGAVATLLRNELDIDAAKDQLGHADWRVTARHYTPKQITRPDRSILIETFARTPGQ